MSKNIEIHIDRIVLDGFDDINKAHLNMAVQEHLSAMIYTQGLPTRLTHIGYHKKLTGGQIQLPRSLKTDQTGNAIATGILDGIKSTSC